MMTHIFAHRGASKYAPENTMAAFKLAVEMKADGIETDVHLSKDHIPVIIHDETVNRTTNLTGLVKNYTYNELKQLDAGSWFSKSFSKESIISLEAFLMWVKSTNLSINIELKNNKIDYHHMESIVYEKIMYYQLRERTIVSTFNPDSIKRLKAIDSQIQAAWLTSKRNTRLIHAAKQLNVNAIHINYRLLNKKIMAQAHDKKVPIRVYTINKRRHLHKCYTL